MVWRTRTLPHFSPFCPNLSHTPLLEKIPWGKRACPPLSTKNSPTTTTTTFFSCSPSLAPNPPSRETDTIGGFSMKFSCEKALLQNAILTTSRAVSSKSYHPCPRRPAFGSGGNRQRLPHRVQPGNRHPLLLPGGSDGNRLHGPPRPAVQRNRPENARRRPALPARRTYKVHISCGMSEFDILGIDPEDFPELPTVEYQNSITLPQPDPAIHDQPDPLRRQRQREPPHPHRLPLRGG